MKSLIKESWMSRFNEVKAFYDKNGHINFNKDSDESNLYYWLNSQRQLFRDNKLSQEKIVLLNSVGMKWVTQRSVFSVDYKYEKAKEYYEQHGHLDIPQKYVLEDGCKLGLWVLNLRQRYKKNQLDQEMIDKLSLIGFMDVVDNKDDIKWAKHLAIATRYYELNGTINVDKNTIFEGLNLSNWISNAINFYKRGILPESRIEDLNKLGIVWDRLGNDDYYWDKHYVSLVNFLKDNDISELGKDKTEIILYNWLEYQKFLIEKEELDEEKLNKLEVLKIPLERRTKNKDNWDYFYNLAKDYYEENGHLLMSKYYKTENGDNLGLWVSTQRMAYNNFGKWTITDEKIKRLNQIGMEWRGLKEGRWDYAVGIFKDYVSSDNDLPTIYRTLVYKNFELGKWIHYNQSMIKNKKLSSDRKQQLLDIYLNFMGIETLTNKQIEMLERKSEKIKEDNNIE